MICFALANSPSAFAQSLIPNSGWVSDTGHASAPPGSPTEGGILDVKAPASNLSYCTHKLCIDSQKPPTRFYPVMWTDKEWKIKYFADPVHPMHEHGDEDGGAIRLTLYVKFVPGPGSDPECTGSLQSAKELKPVRLPNACYQYQKVR